MGEQGLSPKELAALLHRLDALIQEARTIQQQITDRLRTERVRDLPVRSGQPDRRRRPRQRAR